MDVDRHSEIEEVILYIQQHLDDPMSLDNLAGHISYSPYHFSRMFKKKTGLSPLYYVSSLRLQKAKDLLLHTDFTVRDIGLEIGQQSLGTFTSRFSERVGMTPAYFRRSVQQAPEQLQSLQKLSDWTVPVLTASTQYADITGTVCSSISVSGVTLIGLFPKPIPEGMPLFGTLISGTGDFVLTGVKPGRYYLMATTVSWGTGAVDFMLPHETLRTRTKNPITVKPFSSVAHQNVTLHPPKLTDPPILISLPLLMKNFLGRVKK